MIMYPVIYTCSHVVVDIHTHADKCGDIPISTYIYLVRIGKMYPTYICMYVCIYSIV